MRKSKIFIASSSKALKLAENLRNELNSDISEAILWNQESSGKASMVIIEKLEKATQEYDFAVIILTPDDVVFRGGTGDKQQQARDNCIYEAGLFMGAIGRDRCFLVSCVDSNILPVDLQGIIYLPIDPKTDFDDQTQCENAVSKPKLKILDAVKKQKPRQKETCIRSYSRLALLEKEKLLTDGGDLGEDQVIVSSTQALEKDEEKNFDLALQIKRNLMGGVTYVYFFQADPSGAQKICRLLQLILISDYVPPEKRDDVHNPNYRLEIVKEKQDEILENLWDICNNSQLNMFFRCQPPAFKFYLHNATSIANSRAYIKYGEGDDYLEWEVPGQMGYNIWQELKKCRNTKESKAVFLDTFCLKLSKQEEFENELKEQLSAHFAEISEQVKSLCYFGGALGFTKGGTAEIAVNDLLIGANSKASASVSWIKVTKGSWARKDAEGKLIMENQKKIFHDKEELNITQKQDKIACIKRQIERRKSTSLLSA
jgi:CAP12/Pycsar effector protein, TIR domain